MAKLCQENCKIFDYPDKIAKTCKYFEELK